MQAKLVNTQLRDLFDAQCAQGARALGAANDRPNVAGLQAASAHYAEAAGIATSALWLVSTRDQSQWHSRQLGARRYVTRLQERITALAIPGESQS